MLTETKVFGEKYIVREDAKHSDLLHPSLSGGGVSPHPVHPCSLHFPFFPPSMLSPGQAILLKTLFYRLE